ncbi:type II CRISPR RNA-guided endonuclease Cas9, partial [Liquorilactobacillus vini]
SNMNFQVLVNDLNNLRVAGTEDGKLTKEHKEKILNYLKTTDKTVYMLRLIAKTVGIDTTQIKGYRIDKDNKPEFHSLAAYRRARKALKKEEIDLLDFPVAFLDDLGRILTLNTENGEIRKALNDPEFKAKYQFLNEDLIDKLIENKAAFNLSSNNKWHRFSLRTMKLLIPEMMVTSKEQMTILNDMGLLKQDERDYSNKDQIDIKILQDEIYNPVVRKSVKQTIKIFNVLWKKYNKEIAYVVVEMPREKNSADAKKRKEDNQKKYKKEKDESFESFRELTGLSEEGLENKINKFHQLSLMIRLWYQQEGRCPYSGKSIDPEDLLYKPALFQIDHIIPLSVSLDDGLNNKVLCYADMNQQKAKQTPYAFMQSDKGQGFEKLTAYVKNNNRLPGNKKRNLLNTDDLNDIETRKRFIARNLVDTRYASRVVLNELQAFINSKETNVKVSVIRGKLTHKLREKWNLEKSRETHYHHAVDASIIAVTPKLKLWKQAGYSLFPEKVEEQEINIGIGEIVSDKRFAELVYTLPFEETYLNQLRHLEPRIKFKHQVDKKMNRKVSDATIYATRMAQVGKDKRENRYFLGKIKDIYSLNGYIKFKKIYNKDKSKFLMYQKDPKTFNKLETILKGYPDSTELVQQSGKVKKVNVDPFEMYRQENGLIRKYSKRDNGPIIRSMKYYDSKVGNSIDITPNGAKNNVILQSINPWRTDVYYNYEKQDYEIMGIKYCDLRFYKGKYGITLEHYKEVKNKEGISRNAEFIFSLYRNDRIKVVDTGNNLSEEFLFGSRTNPSMKNYVELKPIDRKQYDTESVNVYGKVSNGRLIKKFSKREFKIYKVNTDELGNPFYLKKEANFPKDIIDK